MDKTTEKLINYLEEKIDICIDNYLKTIKEINCLIVFRKKDIEDNLSSYCNLIGANQNRLLSDEEFEVLNEKRRKYQNRIRKLFKENF